jgi:hypothetical protein
MDKHISEAMDRKRASSGKGDCFRLDSRLQAEGVTHV